MVYFYTVTPNECPLLSKPLTIQYWYSFELSVCISFNFRDFPDSPIQRIAGSKLSYKELQQLSNETITSIITNYIGFKIVQIGNTPFKKTECKEEFMNYFQQFVHVQCPSLVIDKWQFIHKPLQQFYEQLAQGLNGQKITIDTFLNYSYSYGKVSIQLILQMQKELGLL